MSARWEWGIVVVLGAAAGGLYLKDAFQRTPEADGSPGPVEEPFQPTVPAAAEIPARVVSTGLHERRGDWRGIPAVADLDRDGNLDLVASIRRWSSGEPAEGLYVFLGDGKGGFRTAVDGIRRDMGYGGSSVADIDGDGWLDIAFSSHDTPPQAFLNQRDGTWRESSSGLFSEGVTADVALADFDGDGHVDLATLGAFPDAGSLAFFKGDGAGGWELREELLDIDQYGSSILAADIDADGVPEIVAATSTGPRVWSWDGTSFADLSEGLKVSEVPTAAGEAGGYIGGSDLFVLPHDFDGDGVKELLACGMIYDGHSPLRVFKLEGEEWTTWGDGLPQDEAIFAATLAELDGEGQPEVVLAGRWGILVLRYETTGRFEVVGRLADSDGPVDVGAGDFDGDGLDEVVFIGFGGIRVLKPSLGGTIQ